jgi:hypothetical protein
MRIIYQMPTVLRIGAFRFHFYSAEGHEPPHIHVATPDGECKFWLEPISLARNRNIETLAFEHYTFYPQTFKNILDPGKKLFT